MCRLQDENCEDKVVCKKFFQGMLSVCDGSITNALKRKKVNCTGTPQSDKRGKHMPHNKPQKVEIIENNTKIINL